MEKNLYNPGTDDLPPGAYIEVGTDGKPFPNGRIVHIDQGDKLPPTGAKGRKWIQEDCK